MEHSSQLLSIILYINYTILVVVSGVNTTYNAAPTIIPAKSTTESSVISIPFIILNTIERFFFAGLLLFISFIAK